MLFGNYNTHMQVLEVSIEKKVTLKRKWETLLQVYKAQTRVAQTGNNRTNRKQRRKYITGKKVNRMETNTLDISWLRFSKL